MDPSLAAINILRYNYRPDSDLYVVYTSGTQFSSLTGVNPAQLREQRLTIKLTYSMMPKSGRRHDKPTPQGFQAPWAVEQQASVEVHGRIDTASSADRPSGALKVRQIQ
jgi:hypothetical protein